MISLTTEHRMTLPEGQELFYRLWAPPGGDPHVAKAVLLVHRGHEHSGRWAELAERFQQEGYWVFAPDLRGHGHSPGQRGCAESFAVLVRDLDRFVHHLQVQHAFALHDMAVVAHSIGAIVAAAWIHDYAPPVRAMVLGAPALRVKLYVPFALPGLRLLHKIKGESFIKSYVRPQMLTHDEEMVRQYADDPLISRNVSVRLLLGLSDTSGRLLADAAAIRTPCLILSAGRDWVVRNSPQRKFLRELGSTTKEMTTYDDFYHAIFHERERRQVFDATSQFLNRAFQDHNGQASLLDADQHGPSKQHFDRLSQPLPPIAPKRIYYGAVKLVLRSVGRLSQGICMGWKTGFNSGEMLDHVYGNRARGATPLGRMIDRIYLNSPGWRGIRQRKVYLVQLLTEAIQRLHDGGQPVRILDIAAGPGRYVLETLAALPKADASAVLCDQDRASLESGRRLAEQFQVDSVEYREADAFDEQALAAIRPRPRVVIASGIYELFADNEKVLASLRGLGEAVDDHGYLIYTNQPWHPQLELIARSLPGLNGKPWVMRCRSQAEMDQLVESAGFAKIDQLTDEQGIFTVSLAQRQPRT